MANNYKLPNADIDVPITLASTEAGGVHTPVVASVSAPPTTTATGTTKVRNIALNSTAAVVKASAGNLFGINIANGHSAAIYVKFYNIAAASVNPASSVPVLTIIVPATSPFTLRGADLPVSFDTAISMRCVTDHGDTGTTAAATLPIIELEIK